MVRLEEVEDETFLDLPDGTKDGALLIDDDDADYTDTGMHQLLSSQMMAHGV